MKKKLGLIFLFTCMFMFRGNLVFAEYDEVPVGISCNDNNYTLIGSNTDLNSFCCMKVDYAVRKGYLSEIIKFLDENASKKEKSCVYQDIFTGKKRSEKTMKQPIFHGCYKFKNYGWSWGTLENSNSCRSGYYECGITFRYSDCQALIKGSQSGGGNGGGSSAKKFTVTYHGNGATSQSYSNYIKSYKSPKIDTKKMTFTSGRTYYSGNTYNVLYNRFKRTGYNFGGWCTKKLDPTGTPYKSCHNNDGLYFAGSDSKFTYNTFGGNGNLYAIWQPYNYKVSYNGNGATSQKFKDSNGNWASDYTKPSLTNNNSVFNSGRTYKYGTSYEPIYNRFSKTGYTFAGWCKKQISAGTDVAKTCKNSSTYTNYKTQTFKNLATSGTVTLYALWEAKSYKINYNSNVPTNVNGKLTVKQNYCSTDVTYIDTADDCANDNYNNNTGNKWTNGTKVSKENNNLKFLHKTNRKYGKTFNLIKNRFKIIVSDTSATQTSLKQEGTVTPLVSNNNTNNALFVENTDKELSFLGWCTKEVNGVDTKTTTASTACTTAGGKFYDDKASVSNLSTGNTDGTQTIELYAVWGTEAVALSDGPGNETTADVDDEVVKVDTVDEKDVKEDNTSEEFEELTPDTDNGGEAQDDNVEENPKTGSILFFLALIIGFSALGYSIYYFKNREKFTV